MGMKPSIDVETMGPGRKSSIGRRSGHGQNLAKAASMFPALLGKMQPAKHMDEKLTVMSLEVEISEDKTSYVSAPRTKHPKRSENHATRNPEVKGEDAVKILQNLIATIPLREPEKLPIVPDDNTAPSLSMYIPKMNTSDTDGKHTRHDKHVSVLGKQTDKISSQPQLLKHPKLRELASDVPPTPDAALQNDLQEPVAPVEASIGERPEPHVLEMKILKIETSFGPAASTSLITQFSNAVIENLDRAPKAAPVPWINAVQAPRDTVVKSIQLRFHPEDLGKINVTMHLRGDELKLKIEVTSHQTEALLRKDHELLQNLMGRAGYDVPEASVVITVNAVDAAPLPRTVVAADHTPDAFLGQGGRQYEGPNSESRNQFHNPRSAPSYAAPTEGEANAGFSKVDTVSAVRGRGIFI